MEITNICREIILNSEWDTFNESACFFVCMCLRDSMSIFLSVYSSLLLNFESFSFFSV